MALDTTRTLGIGYIVKYDLAGTTTWVTLGKVTKVKPPPVEMDFSDTTVLADTREHMQAGLEKATEISFSTLWVNSSTTKAELITAQLAKANANWQFISPHGTPQTATVKAQIKSVAEAEVQSKEGLTLDVVLVTTASPTLS